MVTNTINKVIISPSEEIVLVEGLAGTGKTYNLIGIYNSLINEDKIDANDLIYISENNIDEIEHVRKYDFKVLNHVSLKDLISIYLDYTKCKLFRNIISLEERKVILQNMISSEPSGDFGLPVEFIDDELKFIQTNICANEQADLDKLFQIEKNQYNTFDRKKNFNDYLSYKEKEYIWRLYIKYTKYCMEHDAYDVYSYHQAFLRFVQFKKRNDKMELNFHYLLVDEAQFYNKIQLDIIYCFFNQDEFTHQSIIAYDPLKCNTKTANYFKSVFFDEYHNKVKLVTNYRSNKILHEMIVSVLNHNIMYDTNLDYIANRQDEIYPVMTFSHSKEENEFFNLFDRINYLLNVKHYKLEEILVVTATSQLYGKVKEFFRDRRLSSITICKKEEVGNKEYKVIIFLGVNDGDIGIGPLTRHINTSYNFHDSYVFYKILTRCTDQLIISSSANFPSHFIIPDNVDYRLFRFGIDSKIKILSPFIKKIQYLADWIVEEFEEKYKYKHLDNIQYAKGHLLLFDNNGEKVNIFVTSKLQDINTQDLNKIFINEDIEKLSIVDFTYITTIKRDENRELIRVITTY